MNNLARNLFVQNNILYQLIIRNLKVRYSRPLLGFFWAFISPVISTVVLYIIFSVILKIKTPDCPFVLYLITAVFPWSFFNESLMSSCACLVDSKNILKESKTGHYNIPISIVLANAIIFLPAMGMIVITTFIILKEVPVFIIFLPLVLMFHVLVTASLAVIVSVLYVKFRDIKFILEAVLFILFYFTPVFYSLDLVKVSFSPALFTIYLFNPFTVILNLYRFTLLGGKQAAYYPVLFITAFPLVFSILLVMVSRHIYNKNAGTINDYLAY